MSGRGSAVLLADAHCHLDQVGDPPGAIRRAGEVGVCRILSCTEDAASMRRTLELAATYPAVVVVGLGLHPATAVCLDDREVEETLSFLERHLHLASFVGEVGLDYLHAQTTSQRQRQEAILIEQLRLAARMGLPVNLHSRRCEREVLGVAISCSERWGIPALLHWFTHSVKLVRRACEVPGVYVSVGPSLLTNPATGAVADVIALERLLVETDAPVPFGGVPAEPSWIPRIVSSLASRRGLRPEELAVILDENLSRFLFSS